MQVLLFYLQVCVSPSVRELTHKLAELGWMHRKIKQFIDSKLRDKTQGLVCQVTVFTLVEKPYYNS